MDISKLDQYNPINIYYQTHAKTKNDSKLKQLIKATMQKNQQLFFKSNGDLKSNLTQNRIEQTIRTYALKQQIMTIIQSNSPKLTTEAQIIYFIDNQNQYFNYKLTHIQTNIGNLVTNKYIVRIGYQTYFLPTKATKHLQLRFKLQEALNEYSDVDDRVNNLMRNAIDVLNERIVEKLNQS